MAALRIRGEDFNAAAVPLAHGGIANRTTESPPSGDRIEHSLSKEECPKPLKILAFLSALWYNFLMENREMQTSNTEEMVTISRAEYERLQQEKARNAKLEAKFAALEQEQAQVITSLTLQNEWLLEQLKLSKKKLFGRSSAQAAQQVRGQLTMNAAEAYIFGMNSAGKAPGAVKAHERKRQFGNVLDVVPEGTPTEAVEHRLPENELTCSACGSKMVENGKEVRHS